MKHLFYLIGIAPILWELFNLLSINKYHSFIMEMKEKYKEKVEFNDMETNQKALGVLMLMYTIWIFIGLMTNQWVVYVVILLLSIIPKKWIVIRFIDALCTLLLLLFAMLNEYNFQINLIELLWE